MDILTKELDKNDRRALKHANKADLWKALMKIQLKLHQKTGNQMNESEKYISQVINETTFDLYFK
jgi:hypothetical protein